MKNKVKKARLKKVSLTFLTMLLTLGPLTRVQAQAQDQIPQENTSQVSEVSQEQTKEVTAKAAVMIDAQTGQILYQKNSRQLLPVASLTKILTLDVLMEDIKAGKLKWDQKITASKPVAKMADDWRFSNVPLVAGQQYTVKSLIESMMIVSADGSTEALAIADAGSTAAFNKKMQKVAHEAGVTDAKIYNMIGLSNGELGEMKLKGVDKDVENGFSAYDMALISRHLITKYPEVLDITKQPLVNFTVSPGNDYMMENINYMLDKMPYAPKNGKMDGLKTGKTDAAGYCFVGTGMFANRRVITVVLNVPDEYKNQFIATQNMINKVMDKQQPITFEDTKTLPKKYQTTTIAGKKVTLKAEAKTVWLPQNTDINKIKAKVNWNKKSNQADTAAGHLILFPEKSQPVTINLQVAK